MATVESIASKEEPRTGRALPDLGPLRGLYLDEGAPVVKRSRRGIFRAVSLHIAVDERGTFLYWFSFFRVRRKSFNLSTLHEVRKVATQEMSKGVVQVSSDLLLRLRNADRSLDLVLKSEEDFRMFFNFFNEFRK